MTDFAPSSLANDVRLWARRILVARGDAFVNWVYPAGLKVVHVAPSNPFVVATEHVGGSLTQGNNCAIRRIELVTHPHEEFAAPTWDHPDRTLEDALDGKLDGHRENILSPGPLSVPTLVRVTEWRNWVPEITATDCEIVTYTLYLPLTVPATVAAG